MLKSVHHIQITIPAGGELKARHFYCDVLKLKEIPKPKSLLHKGGFWAKIGSTQIHISIQKNDVDRNSLNAHTCFEVSDLNYWISRLRVNGVTTEANVPIPEGLRLMVRDPFGNRLELLELTNSKD